jgi:hypothetical protein
MLNFLKVDILGAFNCLLKTFKETDKLAENPLHQWMMYAATLNKCSEEDGNDVYQCQQLQKYSEAQSYYSSKYKKYCHSVSHCIKSRLSWFDLQVMRGIILFYSSHDWEKPVQEEGTWLLLIGLSADLLLHCKPHR